MMGGNPSWWRMHSDLRSSTAAASEHEAVAPNLVLSQTQPSTNSLLPLISLAYQHHHHVQDFPHSWSQLLLGGLATEQEERCGASVFQSTRVPSNGVVDVKQEMSSQINNNNNLYDYHNHEEQGGGGWSQSMGVSSPRSCVTSSLSSNSNILDFSTSNKRCLQAQATHQHPNHSNSECNSTSNGGLTKKPRVQSSSTPPLKVRKEKLGDKITALHQLVSPFGKTDTASVLLEAIGYIRFLQSQIQALSSPYLGNDNASTKNQHSDNKDASGDLKGRGLCLVPISCTHHVGNNNGADYWAQSLAGGF